MQAVIGAQDVGAYAFGYVVDWQLPRDAARESADTAAATNPTATSRVEKPLAGALAEALAGTDRATEQVWR